MTAWPKEYVRIPIVDDNGKWDTTTHTIEVYPTDGTYATDKINCTQMNSGFMYQPDSNLVAEKNYWVVKNGTNIYKLPALYSEPPIGDYS